NNVPQYQQQNGNSLNLGPRNGTNVENQATVWVAIVENENSGQQVNLEMKQENSTPDSPSTILACHATNGLNLRNTLVLDSGASAHVVCNDQLIINVNQMKSKTVTGFK